MSGCKSLGRLLVLCAVLVAVPCAALAMGGVEHCDNPDGRTYHASDVYEFDSCGQNRGAQVTLACISSDALHLVDGTMVPYCSMNYESNGSGSGNWKAGKGSTRTLRLPKKFEVVTGTIKITKLVGFH